MNGRLLITALLILSLIPLVFPAAAEADRTLYVRKVENLPEDFIFGMDVSSVLAEEASGVKYYDFEGRETDLFRILADSGVNYIRVRIWNDPYDDQGRGFGGGNCDIGAAVEIGRRATACGMKVLADFHYSDFWADPGKQMVPRAWAGMGIDEKVQAAYAYIRDCLTRMKEAGVDVGMVQTGNETTGFMCGETDWGNIARLMDAGARAVREIFPDALLALHFTDPQDPERFLGFAREIDRYEKQGLIGYDVFATSYYPFWHGTLDNLSAVLTEVAGTYSKKVMVMETSWPYTPEDTDFGGNTVNEESWGDRPYPYTVQGQADCLQDITDTVVNGTPAGIGICWWEGAWITVGTNSWEENHEKWEKYGSGWATSYAAVYDPDDAGKYYGGSAWDNQAFFDPQGKPLESLKTFRLMREGNVTEEEDAHRRTAGSGQDPAEDPAEETAAAVNYLKDPGFEEDSGTWVFTDLGKTQQLYVEDKPQDSLSGTKHAHFWSAAQDSVEFTLEQTVTDLPEGRFRFSVSLMGGDCGETDIYAYVLVDGQGAVRSEQIPVTGWKNWNEGTVPAFDHPAGSEVTVGIYVRCRGTGNGAWGKIDDAFLTPAE